jgi:hypothetical protein
MMKINNNINQMRFLCIPSLFCAICVILSGCTTVVQFDKVEVQPASSYKYSCNKSGLIVSADPYIEEYRVNKAFGYDLLSKKILPVLVVVENKSAEDGFILIEEGAHLLMKDQVEQGTKDNPVGDIQTMDEIRNSQNIQSGLLGASLLLAPAGVILLWPAAIAMGEHQANLSIIQQNIGCVVK